MSDSDVRNGMADAAAPAYDALIDPTADLTRGLRARSRRRHRRLAIAAAGGTAVMALGAAGGLATPEADGEVTVSYNWRIDAAQAEQLERDIEAHGVAAEVDISLGQRLCNRGGDRRSGQSP